MPKDTESGIHKQACGSGDTTKEMSRPPSSADVSQYILFSSNSSRLANQTTAMPEGLRALVWRPRWGQWFPRYAVYELGEEKMLRKWHLWIFILQSLIGGRKGVIRISIALDQSGMACGFAVLRGRDFRFSFMSRYDIQFGPVWVAENWRGQGVAESLCHIAFEGLQDPMRDVWWLCRADNRSSCIAAEKLGLTLLRRAVRQSRFCTSVPHFYSLVDKADE